jgi:glycerol-3-phosphate acyltransferase PlsY
VALAAIGVFAVCVPFVRRLGNASVVASTFLLVAGVWLVVAADDGVDRWVAIWLMAMALIVLARHRSNIASWMGHLTP